MDRESTPLNWMFPKDKFSTVLCNFKTVQLREDSVLSYKHLHAKLSSEQALKRKEDHRSL